MINLKNFSPNNKVPGLYSGVDLSQAGAFGSSAKFYVVAQALSGTATQDEIVQVFHNSQNELFGEGSDLANTISGIFEANSAATVHAVPVAQAGSSAVWTLTVGASASDNAEAGATQVMVGGKTIQVTTSADQTTAQVATALAAEFTAGYTATSSGNVITITSDNKGAHIVETQVLINHDVYNIESNTPLTLSFVAGSGNPDVSDALELIESECFNILVVPYATATIHSQITQMLEERWKPAVKKWTVALTGLAGSISDRIAIGAQPNDFRIECLGVKGHNQDIGFVMAYSWVMGAVSLINEPSKPLDDLELPAILDPVSRESYETQNTLLLNGVSVIGQEGCNAGSVKWIRAVSTQIRDAFGGDDYVAAYNTNTVFQIMHALNYIHKDYNSKLRGKALRKDAMPLQGNTTNLAQIKGRARIWEKRLSDDNVFEDIDTTKQFILVEAVEGKPNEVEITLKPDLVNGLQVTKLLLQPTQD